MFFRKYKGHFFKELLGKAIWCQKFVGQNWTNFWCHIALPSKSFKKMAFSYLDNMRWLSGYVMSIIARFDVNCKFLESFLLTHISI